MPLRSRAAATTGNAGNLEKIERHANSARARPVAAAEDLRMSRFPRIIPLLSFFGAVSLFATACVSGERHRVEDEWTRSYPLAAGGVIEIENANGSIDAQPATGGAVEVVAKRIAKARSAERAAQTLAKAELRERVRDGRVSIEVITPPGWGSDVEVRFSLRVPPGVAVHLSTANGSVSVSGLDAPVVAETVNGAVRATALATQSVDASSVNGAVEVALAAPLSDGGEIALETVNGRVALELLRLPGEDADVRRAKSYRVVDPLFYEGDLCRAFFLRTTDQIVADGRTGDGDTTQESVTTDALQHIAGEILRQEVAGQLGSGATEVGAIIDESEDVDALRLRRGRDTVLQVAGEILPQRISGESGQQARCAGARERFDGMGNARQRQR